MFDTVARRRSRLRLAAFVSATGSAGTIAAGDRLKDEYGTKIVAVEALECPTMLENGFGEHNIQGIGDKHIPLIHNVMNTDVVSRSATVRPTSSTCCSTRRRVGRTSPTAVDAAPTSSTRSATSGFSSTCNVLAAIKTAKLLDLGPDDAIVTVATDGGAMYPSERAKTLAARFGGGFNAVDAARCSANTSPTSPTEHTIECTERDRTRIFNLGYYTWVEQQGTPFELFEARRVQEFWRGLRRFLGVWDEMISDFNARVARRGLSDSC